MNVSMTNSSNSQRSSLHKCSITSLLNPEEPREQPSPNLATPVNTSPRSDDSSNDSPTFYYNPPSRRQSLDMSNHTSYAYNDIGGSSLNNSFPSNNNSCHKRGSLSTGSTGIQLSSNSYQTFDNNYSPLNNNLGHPSPPPSSSNDKKPPQIQIISYECIYCGKLIKYSSNLPRHRRLHNGETPFHCTWPNCNSQFSRSDRCVDHYFDVHYKSTGNAEDEIKPSETWKFMGERGLRGFRAIYDDPR